ncbi:zinc finger protein [Crotalus adamanteus]|uniref:Zinc finger protein n=1 Tax=Crotalus adamanteus TaxID=8729 RepID=A0AAW1B1S5_CROAD
MAEWAPAQAWEWEAEPQHLPPFQPPALFDQSAEREIYPAAEISLWTVVAAIQAVERKVDTSAARLLNLEGRMATAEKKVFECEKTELELGNHLAALGALIQEYRGLQRRLENMENLLKNRNFWILRLPLGPKGQIPKVPVTFDEEEAVNFSSLEWAQLEDWQKELYRNITRGNYKPLVSLDSAMARADLLPPQAAPGGAPHVADQPPAGGRGLPAAPKTAEALASKDDLFSWIKQEESAGPGKWNLEREIPAPLGYEESTPVKSEEQRLQESLKQAFPARLPSAPGDEVFQAPRCCQRQSCLQSQPVPPPLTTPTPPTPPTPTQKPPHPSERTYPDSEAAPPATCLKEGQLRCFKGPEGFALPPRVPAGEEGYGEGVRPVTESGLPQIPEPYLCPESNGSFGEVPVSETAGGPHACSLCPKRFRLKTSLLIHQKTHAVGKSDSPFVCSECGCGFSHQAQLTRHQAVHADRPHQCTECHKAFNRKSSLVVHQKTHRERPRPFQCPQCSKTFIRKQHLDDHTRTHTGEKPYQCPECEKRFAEKSKLTNHYRIHTGERPYRCGQCDKRFVRAHHLVKHQSSVHQAGAKLYSCRECGQSFGHAQAFLSHQASHANGERRHRCTECLKTFARRKYLLEHQRMHTGENPYACPHCGKHFRYKQSLKQHLRMHREQQPPPPPLPSGPALPVINPLEKDPLLEANPPSGT